MKKILLLTVFAFGLADFMVMEDCYAAVENRDQKKSLVLALALAGVETGPSLAAAGSSGAIIPTTGESVPTFDSSLTEPQALENLTAAYRRISEDNRSDAATVRTLAEKYAKITSFSEGFQKKLRDIIAAANQNKLAELGKLLGTGSVVSSEGSTLAIKDIDPKTQKAWDKNVASVKGTLDTL
ncbi:MAG: hypothetical protein FJX18_06015, partial [Alphaproteobacteria bacterium]|nr:hypothetical protein [Alphaproteobacteria bacterium]